MLELTAKILLRVSIYAVADIALLLSSSESAEPLQIEAHQSKNNLQEQGFPHYFPESEFADLPRGSILVSEFKKHLNALREQALQDRSEIRYAVRITLITPFYGDALLRIEDFGTYIRFVYKRQPTIAAPDMKTNSVSHGEISRVVFNRLTAKIRDEDFFALTNKQDVVATDGTIWLLEVYDGSRYHAAYRIGPFSNPVHDIGELAAAIANVNIKKLE